LGFIPGVTRYPSIDEAVVEVWSSFVILYYIHTQVRPRVNLRVVLEGYKLKLSSFVFLSSFYTTTFFFNSEGQDPATPPLLFS